MLVLLMTQHENCQLVARNGHRLTLWWYGGLSFPHTTVKAGVRGERKIATNLAAYLGKVPNLGRIWLQCLTGSKRSPFLPTYRRGYVPEWRSVESAAILTRLPLLGSASSIDSPFLSWYTVIYLER
jgi:hypothetical protein